jgi:hypothetical protein
MRLISPKIESTQNCSWQGFADPPPLAGGELPDGGNYTHASRCVRRGVTSPLPGMQPSDSGSRPLGLFLFTYRIFLHSRESAKLPLSEEGFASVQDEPVSVYGNPMLVRTYLRIRYPPPGSGE